MMKFNKTQESRVLDVAATIAGQCMGGNMLLTRADETRVLLSAARLVAQLPVVLEAMETHPELVYGHLKDVADVAVEFVKDRAIQSLAEETAVPEDVVDAPDDDESDSATE
jgi:hypothetical protein